MERFRAILTGGLEATSAICIDHHTLTAQNDFKTIKSFEIGQRITISYHFLYYYVVVICVMIVLYNVL